jgi:phospholipid-binding lipoprotein MlaA
VLDASALLEEAALDRYEFLRDGYLQRRESQVLDTDKAQARAEKVQDRIDKVQEKLGVKKAAAPDDGADQAPVPAPAQDEATPNNPPVPAPVTK